MMDELKNSALSEEELSRLAGGRPKVSDPASAPEANSGEKAHQQFSIKKLFDMFDKLVRGKRKE